MGATAVKEYIHSTLSDAFLIEPSWFKRVVERWAEGPRLDFKEMVYRLDSEDAKAKFTRHLIAFANVARRTGKSCFIVFGIEDANRTQSHWHDVRNQCATGLPPHWWNDPSTSIHTKQIDGVLEPIRRVAEIWIEPAVPDLHLRYGEVESIFVSCLEIRPTRTSTPFRSKRGYKRLSHWHSLCTQRLFERAACAFRSRVFVSVQ